LGVLEFLAVLAVLVAAVAVISAPLRRPPEDEPEAEADVAGLEAAREAKYREIREADLDRRTGKLSEADWEAIDAQLRSEAADILHALDQARGDQTTS
jgi:hypothetical protein